MKTEFHTTDELIKAHQAGRPIEPLDLAVIPNHMGINLVSVEGMSWTRQDDGQLVSLTIHFVPAPVPNDPPSTTGRPIFGTRS